MKRILIIFFVLLYVASVSGVSLNRHFCCGRLESVTMAILGKHDCGCDNKKDAENCCKDQKRHHKVKAEHKNNGKIPVANTLLQFTPLFVINENKINYNFIPDFRVLNYHAPPPKLHNSQLALNCILRI